MACVRGSFTRSGSARKRAVISFVCQSQSVSRDEMGAENGKAFWPPSDPTLDHDGWLLLLVDGRDKNITHKKWGTPSSQGKVVDRRRSLNRSDASFSLSTALLELEQKKGRKVAYYAMEKLWFSFRSEERCTQVLFPEALQQLMFACNNEGIPLIVQLFLQPLSERTSWEVWMNKKRARKNRTAFICSGIRSRSTLNGEHNSTNWTYNESTSENWVYGSSS